jgi:hypothetical protein
VLSHSDHCALIGVALRAAADYGGGSRVRLRLEMPVYHLGLDREQVNATNGTLSLPAVLPALCVCRV